MTPICSCGLGVLRVCKPDLGNLWSGVCRHAPSFQLPCLFCILFDGMPSMAVISNILVRYCLEKTVLITV